MITEVKRDKNDIFSMFILKTIFKNKYFVRTIQFITLFLFVYAIYYGFENPTKENIFTKNIFWGLFWSFFMIITLVTFGRVFCGICPHGFVGKYITKIGLNKEMPKFLKNRYIGILILFFGWWGVYYTFPGFLKQPLNTAILFTVLSIVAAIFYYVYKDMNYCKYICPLGNLTKAFHKVSFTTFQTYKDACKSCKTFECNTVCSYNLKPFTFEKKNSMDDCTLCMDCSNVCESVNFKFSSPASTLYKKTKVLSSDIWVYLLIFAAISVTMNFHHGLSRSNISDSLPWVISGKYIQSFPIFSNIDMIGFFAFTYASILVISVAFLGMYFSSKVLNVEFKSAFSNLGYAYIPLFIINGLGHILQTFFTKTYSNIINGFIQAFNLNMEQVEPLATRGESWLNIFHLTPYLAIVFSFFILYKRVNLFKVSKRKKILTFISSSSVSILFVVIVLFNAYVFKVYGAKTISHKHSNIEKTVLKALKKKD